MDKPTYGSNWAGKKRERVIWGADDQFSHPLTLIESSSLTHCSLRKTSISQRLIAHLFCHQLISLPSTDMSSNTQQQGIGEENEDEVSSSVPTKQRSQVWDYFVRLPLGPDGLNKASCTACGKVYSANPNAGTSNMKRHIPKCFDLSEPGPP